MTALSTTDLIAFAVFVGALGAAAYTDIRQYLIPNRYPAAIAAAYALFATGHSLEQALWSLAAGIVMLGVGALLMAMRIMGGGDAKLLAATTLWAGPWLAPNLFVATTLAGAVIALAWLSPIRRLMPAAPGAPTQLPITRLRERLSQPVPYGVAITAGGFYVAARLALH